MNKTKSILLVLSLMVGSTTFLFSCKDSEPSGGDIDGPTVERLSKQSEKGVALQAILGYAADLDSLPDNWEKNSFTVEPTVGFVVDQANPYVRYVPVANMEEACAKYGNMTMEAISDTEKSASWSMDGIGSINFTAVNTSDCYATIDLQIQQMPHLTRICLVPPSVIGDNAKFSGQAFYRIGDMVKTKENGQDIYWTCVRCPDGVYGFEKSYWVSFQMNEDPTSDWYNYATVDQTKSTYKLVLPQHSSHSAQLEHVENAYKFFRLMCAKDVSKTYTEETMYEDGLGGMSTSYPADVVKKIAKVWNDNGYWDLVKPKDMSVEDFKKVFSNSSSKTETANFYYYNYSHYSGTNTYSLRCASMYSDSKGKLKCSTSSDAISAKTSTFDIRSYVQNGTNVSKTIDNTAQTKAKNKALVIRVRLGRELCGQGTGKELDLYNPYEKVAGVTNGIQTVFSYNSYINAQSIYVGDIVKDSNGKRWLCLTTPYSGAVTKYRFVSFDFDENDYNGWNISCEDLPDSCQAVCAMLVLYNMFDETKSPNINDLTQPISQLCANVSKCVPIASAFTRRHYPKNFAGNVGVYCDASNCAIKDINGLNRKKIMRFTMQMPVRQSQFKFYCYTQYPDKEYMCLDDANYVNKVDGYSKTDTLSNKCSVKYDDNDQPTTYIKRTGISKTTGVKDYLIVDGKFQEIDNKSIFNEPILIFHYKEFTMATENFTNISSLGERPGEIFTISKLLGVGFYSYYINDILYQPVM